MQHVHATAIWFCPELYIRISSQFWGADLHVAGRDLYDLGIACFRFWWLGYGSGNCDWQKFFSIPPISPTIKNRYSSEVVAEIFVCPNSAVITAPGSNGVMPVIVPVITMSSKAIRRASRS